MAESSRVPPQRGMILLTRPLGPNFADQVEASASLEMHSNFRVGHSLSLDRNEKERAFSAMRIRYAWHLRTN